MANNTFTQNNQLQIAFKKLLGKAHTNPNFEFFNENFAKSAKNANYFVKFAVYYYFVISIAK